MAMRWPSPPTGDSSCKAPAPPTICSPAFFFGLDVQASGVWALNNVQHLRRHDDRKRRLVIGDASHPGAQLTAGSLIVQSGGTLGGQGT